VNALKYNLKTFPDTEDSDNAYEYAEDIARWFKGFKKELREKLSEYGEFDQFEWAEAKKVIKEILGE